MKQVAIAKETDIPRI